MSEFLDQILTTPLVEPSTIPPPPAQQWVINKNRNEIRTKERHTGGVDGT